jgi:hypothetical protein
VRTVLPADNFSKVLHGGDEDPYYFLVKFIGGTYQLAPKGGEHAIFHLQIIQKALGSKVPFLG